MKVCATFVKGSPVGQWLFAERNSLVQLPERSRQSYLVRVVPVDHWSDHGGNEAAY